MAIKSFKRTRHRSAKHDDPNAVDNELLDLIPEPRLADLTTIETGSEDEKAQQYNEWADRLREKRLAAQKAQRGVEPEVGGEHWSADALFAESRRVEENEQFDRPSARRVGELLAVLDLLPDATPEQVGLAYRALAKQHHPDRFCDADADTQAFHAERMASVNRAYHALKQLQRA